MWREDDWRSTMGDRRWRSRVVVDGYFNPRYAMVVVDDGCLWLGAGFDLADLLKHVGFDLGELILGDFARLELQLRLEQPLTLPLRVVDYRARTRCR
jgi:hypothetical protein